MCLITIVQLLMKGVILEFKFTVLETDPRNILNHSSYRSFFLLWKIL